MVPKTCTVCGALLTRTNKSGLCIIHFTERRNNDPVFREQNRKRMLDRWADPKFNPLVLLTAEERRDFDLFRRKNYRRAECLAMIGRSDIV